MSTRTGEKTTTGGSDARSQLGFVLLMVGLLAVASGAVSFTHVKDWTMEHLPAGSPEWAGWINAVISELVPLTAAVAIQVQLRRGKPIWYPVLLMIAAAAFSLSVQIAVATQTFAGWVASAVPAIAFMALGKLAMSLLSKPKTVPTDAATAPGGPVHADAVVGVPGQPGPAVLPGSDRPALSSAPGQPAAVPASPLSPHGDNHRSVPAIGLSPARGEAAAVPAASRPLSVPGGNGERQQTGDRSGPARTGGARRPSPHSRPRHAVPAQRTGTPARPPARQAVTAPTTVPAVDVSPEDLQKVAELLPVARQVAALLLAAGEQLSRPTLVTALREREVPVGTTKAAVLTKVIKAEAASGALVIDGDIVDNPAAIEPRRETGDGATGQVSGGADSAGDNPADTATGGPGDNTGRDRQDNGVLSPEDSTGDSEVLSPQDSTEDNPAGAGAVSADRTAVDGRDSDKRVA